MNKGKGISLLVPFRDDHGKGRLDNWIWLRKYWEHFLPEAEIIEGDSPGEPFSKTCAINTAFKKSTGDVIILLDADCFIDPSVILNCAKEIRAGRKRSPKENIWFIPYKHFFRLTEETTKIMLSSNPKNPVKIETPPDPKQINPSNGSGFGHWFGALIQIHPRETFELVHGMDPRFRGWGGEDVAFTIAVDTLIGPHRLTDNQVLTFWHSINYKKGTNPKFLRLWEGQTNPQTNWNIAGRYRKALRNKEEILKIINEWVSEPEYEQYLINN